MPNQHTKNSIPMATRLWGRVDTSTECWLWTGTKNRRTGYGYMKVDGRHVDVHRIAYELAHGPLPPGQCALHRCDVRLCVRPEHLFRGTKGDNARDMVSKGRSATGDRNGSRLHPERVSRGAGHGAAVSAACPHGERHYRARLTEADVLAARAAYARGEASQTRLAAQYGVSRGTMQDALMGRTWHHVPLA